MILDGTVWIIFPDVEQKSCWLPSSNKHSDVDSIEVIIRIVYSDNNLAVCCVLKAKCCSCIIVLARWTEVWSITKTLLSPPQIYTLPIILTRVGWALI